MAELNLTQDEVDILFQMEKVKIDNAEWELPDLGGKITVPLTSRDKKESFLLDVSRRQINLKKQTYQNRAREAIILARLDLGVGHRNPNGEEIGAPHIHLYKEGFGDKWAFPIPANVFKDLSDSWQTLDDFMNYCQIVEIPNFTRQRGLFS
jgi:hypothetical protein